MQLHVPDQDHVPFLAHADLPLPVHFHHEPDPDHDHHQAQGQQEGHGDLEEHVDEVWLLEHHRMRQHQWDLCSVKEHFNITENHTCKHQAKHYTNVGLHCCLLVLGEGHLVGELHITKTKIITQNI